MKEARRFCREVAPRAVATGIATKDSRSIVFLNKRYRYGCEAVQTHFWYYGQGRDDVKAISLCTHFASYYGNYRMPIHIKLIASVNAHRGGGPLPAPDSQLGTPMNIVNHKEKWKQIEDAFTLRGSCIEDKKI
ncbi:hypothetical protein EVAR_80150_1 [Eumeta japonica]|uniref:Uncharacterized protein n=1 Tax=Eumeta variegata TaxID=151549 RepID=A0A4C1YE59_EUMVA|nr:hypothetical protein EVAR_80150_1 [Eumeta japonica]